MRGDRRQLFLALGLALVLVVACSSSESTSQSEKDWIEVRLDSFADIYNITQEGRQILASLDVRQMVGQPAWFGSTGFDGFTGVGQAVPTSVAHELGHSYWGAFAITDRPDLSWDVPTGESVAPALNQYHEDLKTFMLQPPDRYEPLRERFRKLPNLFKEDSPDLFHFGEADMVKIAAGDMNLVPPILRKYFDRYLTPGSFGTWADILRWYQGLSRDEKRVADAYLDMASIPQEVYRGLEPSPSSVVSQDIKTIIEGEERQRLLDFADQFELITESQDSLKDAANVDRGFPFWRSYLRGMYRLHKRYPDLLQETGASGKAEEIVVAFDALMEAEELAIEEQVVLLRKSLEENPFFYNFLPILDNRVLADTLDAEAGDLPEGAIQKGAGAFVEELRGFIAKVDEILEMGRSKPSEGARALEEYLSTLQDQSADKFGQDLNTIFEIFFDTDSQTVQRILAELRDATIQNLLEANPARTRFILSPSRVLDALDVEVAASSEVMSDGIKVLLDNSSGNFAIDRPFTEETYRRVAERGMTAPQETLSIIKESKLPLPGFLSGYPEDAMRILSSDMEQTLEMIINSGPIRDHPVRLVYLLMYVDPEFVVEVVGRLRKRGRDDLVTESLIHFAYDHDRLDVNPVLRISLEGDARFLLRLLGRMGEAWLSEQVASAITSYGINIDEGEVDSDFLDAYRRTLKAALDTIEEPSERLQLEEALTDAFSEAGLEF